MKSHINPQRVHGKYARMLGTVLGGAALAWALAGCSGGEPSTTTGNTSGQTSSAGGPGLGSGGGGPTGMPSGMMGGGMGGMGGGAQQVAATPVPKNTTQPPHRVDPFQPWFSTEVPPPPVLSQVQPVRIAIANSAAEEKPAGVEIQQVPNRRVAGILTGNGVYALLDDFGGNPEVVKPGQTTSDGYRVASINSNSVTLKKVIDNYTYTQVVPLTDAGSSVSRFSGPAGSGMGSPGMLPGMMPPGGVSGAGGRGKGGALSGE